MIIIEVLWLPFVKILRKFVTQHYSSMEKRLHYIQPDSEIELDYSLLELVCQSPVDGGLEGTKDEDWVI